MPSAGVYGVTRLSPLRRLHHCKSTYSSKNDMSGRSCKMTFEEVSLNANEGNELRSLHMAAAASRSKGGAMTAPLIIAAA